MWIKFEELYLKVKIRTKILQKQIYIDFFFFCHAYESGDLTIFMQMQLLKKLLSSS